MNLRELPRRIAACLLTIKQRFFNTSIAQPRVLQEPDINFVRFVSGIQQQYENNDLLGYYEQTARTGQYTYSSFVNVSPNTLNPVSLKYCCHIRNSVAIGAQEIQDGDVLVSRDGKEYRVKLNLEPIDKSETEMNERIIIV